MTRPLVYVFYIICIALQCHAAVDVNYSLPKDGSRERAEFTSPPVPDELVIYERGNLPIILLAPHGGTVEPTDLPAIPNASKRDMATDKLVRALADELAYTDAEGIERRPHMVINRLHRKFVEPNKSWKYNLHRGWIGDKGTPIGPHPRAERVYRDFHACAAYAVLMIEQEHGAGVLLDLHGLAASHKLDMYGYIIRASDLHHTKDQNRPATHRVLATAIRKDSSIRFAASRKRTSVEIANLVRGPKSLASLVDEAYRELYPEVLNSDGSPRGRPATPSLRFPNPKGEKTPNPTDTYFNGAYDISTHSSRQSGICVDAIQIEVTPDARSNEVLRIQFARAMARALREFLKIHYGLDISPPELTPRSVGATSGVKVVGSVVICEK